MQTIVINLFVLYRLCIDQVQLCFRLQSLFVLALVVSLTICIINTDMMAKEHTKIQNININSVCQLINIKENTKLNQEITSKSIGLF